MNKVRFRRIAHRVVRWSILLAVLAYVSWEFYSHSHVSKVSASVHALCPLGGLESLWRFIASDGATLAKVFSGTMGLFFVALGVALVFKRSFCGTVCPLGTLQGLFGALGRKLFGAHRFTVPPKLDRVLRFAKYPVLVLTVVMAFLTGTLWIQAFDPWAAYAHAFNPSELLPAYTVGLIILVVSLLLSLLYEQAFCKYLCPMGAFTAVVGLASPWKVRRNAAACTDCGLCDRACPVNLPVSKATAVTHAECLSCGDCAAACPAPGALRIGFPGRLSPPPAAAVAIAAGMFFLAVLALQLVGFDRYSGRQEPTLRELAKASGMSPAEFKAQYGLPAWFYEGTRATALEEAIPLEVIARSNKLEPAALKERLGLPADLPDSTPWGEAYGAVTLSAIAAGAGVTVDQFKEWYGLGAGVGPDTAWREVKDAVRAAEARMAGEAGGSCSME